MKSMAGFAILSLAVVLSGSFKAYTCRCFADYGLTLEDFGPVTMNVKKSVPFETAREYLTQACMQKYNSKAARAIQCVEL